MAENERARIVYYLLTVLQTMLLLWAGWMTNRLDKIGEAHEKRVEHLEAKWAEHERWSRDAYSGMVQRLGAAETQIDVDKENIERMRTERGGRSE